MNLNDLFLLADEKGVITEVSLRGEQNILPDSSRLDVSLVMDYKTESGYEGQAYIAAAQVGGNLEDLAPLKDSIDLYRRINFESYDSSFEKMHKMIMNLPSHKLFGFDEDDLEKLSEKTKSLIGEGALQNIQQVINKPRNDNKEIIEFDYFEAIAGSILRVQKDSRFHFVEGSRINDALSDRSNEYFVKIIEDQYGDYAFETPKGSTAGDLRNAKIYHESEVDVDSDFYQGLNEVMVLSKSDVVQNICLHLDNMDWREAANILDDLGVEGVNADGIRKFLMRDYEENLVEVANKITGFNYFSQDDGNGYILYRKKEVEGMFEEYEYSIAKHYITALEYGDYSGLSDDEEAQLERFLKSLPEGPSHWDWGDADDTNFKVDEVSGLRADCVEAKLMVQKPRLSSDEVNEDVSRRRNRPRR